MSDFITNAELRIEAERLCDENDQLKDENAKLRELCEDMLSCIQIRAEFSRPPTMEMYEMFYKRAYQLEVDKC